MRIGFDVDGVLADFNAAFISRVIDVTGKDLFPARPFDIPTWDHPQHYGYTEAECSAVWKSITADVTFWLNLPTYEDTRATLGQLACAEINGDDIYFITSRPGVEAKAQTENWLANLSFDRATVLISSAKGLCAQALNLDVYIDDRDLNVQDVAVARAGKTRVYLVNRPWNTTFDASAYNVTRIDSPVELFATLVPA